MIEILSRANKSDAKGRRQYLRKRDRVLQSRAYLVEIDLLRAGRRIDEVDPGVTSQYRTVVSRGHRPREAALYLFSMQQAIPLVPIPLLPEDEELVVDLNQILHQLYDRARYDLRIDYRLPTVPPLDVTDDRWARELLVQRTNS